MKLPVISTATGLDLNGKAAANQRDDLTRENVAFRMVVSTLLIRTEMGRGNVRRKRAARRNQGGASLPAARSECPKPQQTH